MKHRQHTETGFGMVMAIIVLVIMASLAAALVKIGSTQQLTLAQDVESARAWQAARSGTEWGLYQALQTGGQWNSCPASGTSQTLNLTVSLGFSVTVTCSSSVYNEGETAPGTAREVRVFRIRAVACNSTVCPDNVRATGFGYVERVREVIATN